MGINRKSNYSTSFRYIKDNFVKICEIVSKILVNYVN